MPIPEPRKGEKESEYISRCMHVVGKEEKRNRALAICYRKYRERRNK